MPADDSASDFSQLRIPGASKSRISGICSPMATARVTSLFSARQHLYSLTRRRGLAYDAVSLFIHGLELR